MGGCPYRVKVTPSFFGSQVSEAQPTSEDGNVFPILPIFCVSNSLLPVSVTLLEPLGLLAPLDKPRKLPRQVHSFQAARSLGCRWFTAVWGGYHLYLRNGCPLPGPLLPHGGQRTGWIQVGCKCVCMSGSHPSGLMLSLPSSGCAKSWLIAHWPASGVHPVLVPPCHSFSYCFPLKSTGIELRVIIGTWKVSHFF